MSEQGLSGAYNRDGEGDHERLDRHWNELLQELRLAQTGTQILFAFLLGIGFQTRFLEADEFAHVVYVVTLAASALAVGLLLAPVSFHRIVFQRRLRDRLVQITHHLASGGLAFLVIAMCGGVLLAADAVLDRGIALGITAAVLAWFIAFWYVMPTYIRHSSPDHATREPDRAGRGTRTSARPSHRRGSTSQEVMYYEVDRW